MNSKIKFYTTLIVIAVALTACTGLPEEIQNLDLSPAGKEDTAVATTLTASFRTQRNKELHMIIKAPLKWLYRLHTAFRNLDRTVLGNVINILNTAPALS